MITIDTIGKMIEYKQWLWVHCNARDCWNRAPVDLPALAARLGADHRSLAPFLKPYFVCSKCGSRDVGFTTDWKCRTLSAGAHTAQPVPDWASRPETSRRRRARKHGPRI